MECIFNPFEIGIGIFFSSSSSKTMMMMMMTTTFAPSRTNAALATADLASRESGGVFLRCRSRESRKVARSRPRRVVLRVVRAVVVDDDDDAPRGDDDDVNENEGLLLAAGLGGVVASCVTGYSLYTLKNTGCGLPAGPGGIVGAIEGISYLGVAGLLGASAYAKKTTGSGLPAGPYALLGLAEGVAFVLALAGVYVGIAQIIDYGYIPNAVPVEGGKCA